MRFEFDFVSIRAHRAAVANSSQLVALAPSCILECMGQSEGAPGSPSDRLRRAPAASGSAERRSATAPAQSHPGAECPVGDRTRGRRRNRRRSEAPGVIGACSLAGAETQRANSERGCLLYDAVVWACSCDETHTQKRCRRPGVVSLHKALSGMIDNGPAIARKCRHRSRRRARHEYCKKFALPAWH